MEIYQDKLISIQVEPSTIPWYKIFALQQCKEMSDCNQATQTHIWHTVQLMERLMLDYYQPDKINIASFANIVPQVHWHIMARYMTDSHFPQPMWGPQQRECAASYPDMEAFVPVLQQAMQALVPTEQTTADQVIHGQ